jgi:formylglycine-generating enzyme required for sulfatase activity
MARTPVTNTQYAAFVEATCRDEPPVGRADHPVVNVSWHDAMACCRWLTETTGRPYRLPSEAEWEKAARGTEGRIYPWGDEPADESRCNFGMNVGATTPVGMYSPQLHPELAEGGDSAYECVDMAGNVWEWTRSVYEGYPYDPEDGREDQGAEGPRVLRGGAFLSDQGLVRCASRLRNAPDYGHGDLGFRVCVAAQQE